jgi:hypothetical protein
MVKQRVPHSRTVEIDSRTRELPRVENVQELMLESPMKSDLVHKGVSNTTIKGASNGFTGHSYHGSISTLVY